MQGNVNNEMRISLFYVHFIAVTFQTIKEEK